MIADNQRLLIEGAARQDGTLNAGNWRELSSAQLAGALRPLFTESTKRVVISEAGRRLVDGHGAERVARELLQFAGQNAATYRNCAQ